MTIWVYFNGVTIRISASTITAVWTDRIIRLGKHEIVSADFHSFHSKVPRMSNPTVRSHRRNYRILSDPIGIRLNPWYRIPTGSCWMLECSSILRFRHFPASDNFRRISIGPDGVRLIWA